MDWLAAGVMGLTGLGMWVYAGVLAATGGGNWVTMLAFGFIAVALSVADGLFFNQGRGTRAVPPLTCASSGTSPT